MSLTLTRTTSFSRNGTTLSAVLSGIVAFVAREIRIRRDLRQLSTFGDAALHDIGLSRGNIEDAVRYGRPFQGTSRVVEPLATDCHGPSVPSFQTEWR
ncbi:DUF1127 domain-containing protein [Microvirga rosea]|uniref:DUF1127 domain-containing protein n=1 Tax=Microvirga rosea TaxID=2715425 RepID=UPI001D0AD0D9|nr:DUF1127 domain-containing protein [Microvirga rosea]MCB8821880.1 DUF1127 domain-containing protein [Microvirga rosea]